MLAGRVSQREKNDRRIALVVDADCICCTDIDDRTTATLYISEKALEYSNGDFEG